MTMIFIRYFIYARFGANLQALSHYYSVYLTIIFLEAGFLVV